MSLHAKTLVIRRDALPERWLGLRVPEPLENAALEQVLSECGVAWLSRKVVENNDFFRREL